MPALLEVAGLRKQYGAIVVADDVTFSLEPGDCLGMIGPNGAGKSSVFNLIAGTVAEDGGTIRFEGRDLKGLPAHLRARLGIVRAFQIPQPFPHLTVYENVLAAAAFGAGLPGSEAAARALGVLEDIGLAGKAHVLAGQLPLLDRKRLELGKALGSRAKLLLLDEIAAGLTEREVEELVALIATPQDRSRHHLDRAHPPCPPGRGRPDHGPALRQERAGGAARGRDDEPARPGDLHGVRRR